jgi:hypothetical protein
MNAAKISQTIVLPKPLSAHCADAAGVSRTRPSIAAAVTPAMPMAAAGIGSVMISVITVTNSAK